ncbi:MAG: hydrolase [Alphaproteobacteria bacterium]|nr:hydrolase [Alphaproteobacteria bacterium]
MIKKQQPVMAWIAAQQADMLAKTIDWCNVNTGSANYDGLLAFAAKLQREFACLGDVELIDLADRLVVDDAGNEVAYASAPLLRLHNPCAGKPSILLVAHYDTVYARDHEFQTCIMDGDKLRGPGVADLKGGMVVMLYALQALEKSGLMDEVGIEILLNPDEEIGSPASGAYLIERAKYHDVGLIFEPALADGTLVGARKGSGNFTVRVQGKAAHAGREIEAGRNALVQLMKILTEVEALHGARDELTVNVAHINGGGALNMVPDMAVGRFNCRLNSVEDAVWLESQLDELVAKYNEIEGYSVEKFGGITRNPKPATEANLHLQEFVAKTGAMLNIEVSFKHTGGVCDGNNLMQSGLPNIDTLGVRGANIHSPDEYMIVESLTERAQFVALILMRMANGEYSFKRDVPKEEG